MNLVYVILAILAAFILIFIWIYNSIIRKRNQIEEAWSDIEVQLKRRYDLIPNVVETVKGYMAHEKEVLENVTKARTQAMSAHSLPAQQKAENVLSGTLKTLFAVAENYPDLKANANFLDLQRELADTENKIQAARRFYNSVVLSYNTLIQSFPVNLLAEAFRFPRYDFFELEAKEEKEPVKVKF